MKLSGEYFINFVYLTWSKWYALFNSSCKARYWLSRCKIVFSDWIDYHRAELYKNDYRLFSVLATEVKIGKSASDISEQGISYYYTIQYEYLIKLMIENNI